MGHSAGPSLSSAAPALRPQLWPPDPGTPTLTWLMFKSSSRDTVWSRCSVCHRAASCWHCLWEGGTGLKTGQARATPSQEHVLTRVGKSHFAPSLAWASACSQGR